jgi:SnoaL-like domain
MDETGGPEPVEPETGQEHGPTPVLVAYASALDAGDAGLAADLYAENALLTSADERLSGRSGIAGWHEDLLSRGAVMASPSSQGNDTGRLEVDSPTGRYVVELAFDAAGRIGTARWLTPDEADQPQEERERTAT